MKLHLPSTAFRLAFLLVEEGHGGHVLEDHHGAVLGQAGRAHRGVDVDVPVCSNTCVHHLRGCLEALGGVDNRLDAGSEGLRPVSLLHLLHDPVRTWALEKTTVRSIWGRQGRSGHDVGFEVGAVVVTVLGVDLHWLDVEGGGGVDKLGESLGIGRNPDLGEELCTCG